VDPGFRGRSPRFFFCVVFGSIMMSGFVVHGIGFFDPWFSDSDFGIRVLEVG
jgi:hypothetical protein